MLPQILNEKAQLNKIANLSEIYEKKNHNKKRKYYKVHIQRYIYHRYMDNM